MSFAEKVKLAREAKGYSQAALAERLGVCERTVTNYESKNKATTPRKYALKKLAKELGVTVSYLMDDEVDDPQANLDQDLFMEHVERLYGQKGAKEAARILAQTSAMFAGGELNDEGREQFMESIMEIYLMAKARSRKKYSPNNQNESA